MGLAETSVQLAAETALRDIMDGLKGGRFDLVVIDSIQTLWSDAHEAGPGSVTQVRACAGELVRLAKKRGIAVILVGHEGRARFWWNSRPWWRPPCTERRAPQHPPRVPPSSTARAEAGSRLTADA